MSFRTIIAALLFTIAGSASAADVGVHLGTYHQNGNCVNGVNPGLYYRADNGLTFGTYYNSCETQTYYAGYTTQEWNRFRLVAIAATGYRDGLTVAVFPALRVLSLGRYDFIISGMADPVVAKKSILHLSVETRF